MTKLHELQKTSTDLAGKKVITTTQLIARTYGGEAVEVDGGDGAVTIKRLPHGRYSMDGKGRYSLLGLKARLGSYHAEFGETVFWPA